MAEKKQEDQLEHTYSCYVRIRDVALKTCQRRWMIGKSGVRGSGISMLAARHDDDDDLFLWMYHHPDHWACGLLTVSPAKGLNQCLLKRGVLGMSKLNMMVRIQFLRPEEWSLLPGSLWSAVVVSVKVPFIDQINLFENYSFW